MQISIIIPTLNEDQIIGSIMKSIHDRAEDEIHQVIIADGGSSDQTRKIATKGGAFIVECKQRGRSAQMNEGAKVATGDILYFLHADTIPPKGFDRLIKHGLVKAGAGCFRLKFTSDHLGLRFYGWCTRFKSTFLRFGDQSLFVKKDLFYKVDTFNEKFFVMEDQKMVRDLKKITPFIVLEDTVVTSARKYEMNGIFRLQFVFMIILVLYYFGARQETLLHLYRSIIKGE